MLPRRPRIRRLVVCAVIAGMAASLAGGVVIGWSAANATLIASQQSAEVPTVEVPVYTDSGDAIVVPDVRGLAIDVARQALADAGIPAVIVTEERRPAALAIDSVVSQDPPFGTTNPAAVKLTISDGASVPPLVGQSKDAAVDVLNELGARAEIQAGYSPDAPVASVLGTVPSAGEAFVDSVVVVVNSAPGAKFLSSLSPVEGRCSSGSSFTISGTKYTQGVVCSAGSRGTASTTSWLLGRAVDVVEGVVGVSDSAPAGSAVKLTIVGDGAVLFEQNLSYGTAVPISLRTGGILRLSVSVTSLSNSQSSTPAAAFGDVRLLGAVDAVEALE